MTLDEAILHYDDVANSCDGQCSLDHKQLSAWLRELKDIKGNRRWVSCKDRNPLEYDNPTEFLVTLEDKVFKTRYVNTIMWDGSEWDWFYTDEDKVIAWMEMPTEYKGE